jgi:hypothetical protein
LPLPAPAATSPSFVAKDGGNSFAVASAANGRLSPGEVKKAERAISDGSAVRMQIETPLKTV